MTEEHNCDFFFYEHLACSNQALNFFVCVHTPNATKVTKFRTIPMKLWFLKIQNRKFSGQSDQRATEGWVVVITLIYVQLLVFVISLILASN